MFVALVTMYTAIHSIIGTAIGPATVGVRQGSPTSCILFVLFINDSLKLLKENCGCDGLLSWLHVLVLMNDAVLLSTSRNDMAGKVWLLKHFCNNYGMTVNNEKTKLFAINVGVKESARFILEGMTVKWCDRYTYLGSFFFLFISKETAQGQNKSKGKKRYTLFFKVRQS